MDGELSAGAVISLALSPAPVFDLVALEVGLVLHNLDEAHDCPALREIERGKRKKKELPMGDTKGTKKVRANQATKPGKILVRIPL